MTWEELSNLLHGANLSIQILPEELWTLDRGNQAPNSQFEKTLKQAPDKPIPD